MQSAYAGFDLQGTAARHGDMRHATRLNARLRESMRMSGMEAAEAEYLARYRATAAGYCTDMAPCFVPVSAGEAQRCPVESDEQQTAWVEIPVPISDDDAPDDEMDPPDDW